MDLANAVNAFIAYCKAEALNINYKKSKVLHFTRSRKLKLEPLKITGGYLEKKGGKHLPAAIQIFNAKVVPKLLYGCEVWTTAISAVLSGRYSRVPIANRTCSCNDTALETMEHVMLFCPNWTDERSRFLTPLVNKFHLPIQPWIVSLLLQDSDCWITEMTANFLLSVMKRKAALTSSLTPQMQSIRRTTERSSK
ncbi:Hypothetical predicted protein [Podarcis lilfordi]|uniref:Uncharacterized protein n=1 Tax=Podarcis lilfordi TaxID=74358 RepID=A0AA35KG46_9SAUR|nr:Hypothetical predicted protein [Podarcis lilfordi]